ncbi:MAG: hypothetical protein GXO76_05345, partial [Calditrichaeota bacterium]|nr:hypothetical protein [Calditrichota bacterium]
MKKITYVFFAAIFIIVLWTTLSSSATKNPKDWQLILSSAEQSDAAVQLAVADFIRSAKKHRISVPLRSDQSRPSACAVLLGDPRRNAQTARFVSKKRV